MVPVTAVVTPKDCSRCHPDEAVQYSKSKHANTLEIIWKIDPWLNDGMNSDFERVNGCFHCHTRHRFSVMEARKPQACGQCHLGPDHP